MQTTKPHKTEQNAAVLFDEDYRSHIAHLDKKLAIERGEVIKLREQIRFLTIEANTDKGQRH